MEFMDAYTGINWAEDDAVLSAFGAASTPDDPGYSMQWAMNNLSLLDDFSETPLSVASVEGPVRGAWDRTTGSESIVICVIDSGIDYTHSDLQGNIWVNEGEIPGNGIDDDENGMCLPTMFFGVTQPALS